MCMQFTYIYIYIYENCFLQCCKTSKLSGIENCEAWEKTFCNWTCLATSAWWRKHQDQTVIDSLTWPGNTDWKNVPRSSADPVYSKSFYFNHFYPCLFILGEFCTEENILFNTQHTQNFSVHTCLFAYILTHSHSWLILLVRNQHPRFLLWISYKLKFLRISWHVPLVSGDKRRSLYVCWKGNEQYNSVHPSSQFISLLALLKNTPTTWSFCEAWTKHIQLDFNISVLFTVNTKWNRFLTK